MSTPSERLLPCPPSERTAALRVLYEGLPFSLKASLVEAIRTAQLPASRHEPDPQESDSQWQGLFYLKSPQPKAAWLQPMPGRTAVFWPPQPSDPERSDSQQNDPSDRISEAISELIARWKLPLVQFLLTEQEQLAPELADRFGFSKFASLEYRHAEPRKSDAKADQGLRFVGHADREPERLARLIQRTYVGTQDCPALDGLRDMQDVLAGYRAQGTFMPEHWYRVERTISASGHTTTQDVGVLLLASYPKVGNWELLYMALVPESRGQRLGKRLVQKALHEAALEDANRVVLAVDAANAPAIARYKKAGFQLWERRVVYARTQTFA